MQLHQDSANWFLILILGKIAQKALRLNALPQAANKMWYGLEFNR